MSIAESQFKIELEGPDALERYRASRSDDDPPGWDDADRYRGRGQ